LTEARGFFGSNLDFKRTHGDTSVFFGFTFYVSPS
jgi:hypothetical protein